MRVFRCYDGGNVCLRAEAPEGAVADMADRDDFIEEIDWTHKIYKTRRQGWLPFPEKVYKPDDLVWEVHRVGATIYPERLDVR